MNLGPNCAIRLSSFNAVNWSQLRLPDHIALTLKLIYCTIMVKQEVHRDPSSHTGEIFQTSRDTCQ